MIVAILATAGVALGDWQEDFAVWAADSDNVLNDRSETCRLMREATNRDDLDAVHDAVEAVEDAQIADSEVTPARSLFDYGVYYASRVALLESATEAADAILRDEVFEYRTAVPTLANFYANTRLLEYSGYTYTLREAPTRWLTTQIAEYVTDADPDDRAHPSYAAPLIRKIGVEAQYEALIALCYGWADEADALQAAGVPERLLEVTLLNRYDKDRLVDALKTVKAMSWARVLKLEREGAKDRAETLKDATNDVASILAGLE